MTSRQQQLIEFNGESVAIDSPVTVTGFLQQQNVSLKRFVVVINDEIVPKSDWDSHQISAGDQLDIMSPISGG